MAEGKVEAIFIGPNVGQPMKLVEAVAAVAGCGLEGDRNWQGEGGAPKSKGPDREVTLIEAEALDALKREDGIVIEPAESRRNILTRGVPLNHLVDRQFQVGSVVLRGIRLCEPCGHLESLTRPGVMKGLIHRGGLRARIVSGGTLHVGDAVEI